MKLLSILLCLFFVSSSVQSPPASLTEAARLVEEERMFDFSYNLSRLAIELDISRQEEAEKIEELDLQLEKLEKQISSLQLEMDPMYQSGALQAKAMQAGWSGSWQSQIELSECYEKYQKLTLLQDESQQKQKQLKKRKKQVLELEDQLEEIEEAQQILMDRASLLDLSDHETEPSEEHKIQGTAGLPSIGSAYSYSTLDLQACLALSDYSDIIPSGSFIWPVPAGTISAGTWAYPSGGVHVGLDIAASLYSDVLAVAGGIILYADAPVDSNCGYVGNYCGYPGGGGNTIHMLAVLEEGLFAVSYFHLSNQHYVHAGQTVAQGDKIALSGNSGNSSGPHTHVEIFVLTVSYEEAIAYFSSTADFSWGCGWKDPTAVSYYGYRIRPELVLGT